MPALNSFFVLSLYLAPSQPILVPNAAVNPAIDAVPKPAAVTGREMDELNQIKRQLEEEHRRAEGKPIPLTLDLSKGAAAGGAPAALPAALPATPKVQAMQYSEASNSLEKIYHWHVPLPHEDSREKLRKVLQELEVTPAYDKDELLIFNMPVARLYEFAEAVEFLPEFSQALKKIPVNSLPGNFLLRISLLVFPAYEAETSNTTSN